MQVFGLRYKDFSWIGTGKKSQYLRLLMLRLENCPLLHVVISSKQTTSSKSFLIPKLYHKACKYAIWCSSITTEIEGIFAIIYSLILYLSSKREVTEYTICHLIRMWVLSSHIFFLKKGMIQRSLAYLLCQDDMQICEAFHIGGQKKRMWTSSIKIRVLNCLWIEVEKIPNDYNFHLQHEIAVVNLSNLKKLKE